MGLAHADQTRETAPRESFVNELIFQEDRVQDPAKETSAQPSSLAAFMKKHAIQGRPLFIIVDAWAPWCGPCKRTLPSFIRLAKDFQESSKKGSHHAKGVGRYHINGLNDKFHVKGLAISIEHPASVKMGFDIAGIRTANDSFPLYFSSNLASLMSGLELTGIPATIIIAPNGQIIFKKVGGMNWDLEDNRKDLEKLIHGWLSKNHP